ncbi:CopG family transcriptional regulator [Enterococcus faecium]|nr:CopG family transcriptional regulator [Enterococcus faecium]
MISNEKKRVVVTLTKEVADNLDKIAKQMGLSKSGRFCCKVLNKE